MIISLGEVGTGMEGKGTITQGTLLSCSSVTVFATRYWPQAEAFSPSPSYAAGEQAVSLAFYLAFSLLAATRGASLTWHASARDHSCMTRSALHCCSKIEAERHSEGELIL